MFVTNRVIAHIPCHAFRLCYYRNVLNMSIGADTYIHMDAWFDTKGNVTLGANSVINEKCRIDNRATVSIGRNVSISAEVCILTADHDLQRTDFGSREKPVTINDYVFIGTRALILPGVVIGEGAAVAAGSVVTKSVAPYDVVAGVPAKTIGTRPRGFTYTICYGPFLS